MVIKARVAAFSLSAFCFLLSALASELTVDKRSLQPDDSVLITLTLDGVFASNDAPRVPVQNLIIDGPPSVSTEFHWVDGVSSRRKVFHYLAHPRASGAASVGPVTVRDSSGVVLTLPAIPLVIATDTTAASNDPVVIIRELIATNRDPIFVTATADRTEAFEGEEIVVTWTLYSGETIQQYSLGRIPKLEDFWTEELDVRNEQPQQIMLGGVPAQKMTIRRAALFPLRSGALTVGPMAVHAAVMKRVSAGDPFGLFEGVMTDVHRRSTPIVVNAKPIPAGVPVIGVANMINLTCGGPSQKSGGPVVFDVSLAGRANLRSVQPPPMQSPIDGNVQVVDRGVRVYPVNNDAWMTRRWRYLVFPGHGGELALPALATTFLMPNGERREVRCEAKTLEVSASSAEGLAPAPARKLRSTPGVLPLSIAAAIAVVLLIGLPRARKQLRLRNDVQRLVRATPAETRAAVEEVIAACGIDPIALMREASDRGDSFRAFRSLIDAAEHDRIIATPREIAHRVRDVIVGCRLIGWSADRLIG